MIKRVRHPAHGRHPIHLDTIGGVAAEMARLYRLTINKRIGAAEAARLVYILREVRCSLEAVPAPEPVQTPATIVIHAVEPGRFFRNVDGEDRLLLDSIEHEPAPQTMLEAPDSVSTLAPESFDRARDIEPESIEEARRQAELSTLSREELLVLAGVDDADER